MNNEPIQLEGHCYVLLRGNWHHPITDRRFDLVWYPETAMTSFECHSYRPYVKSIVTENAWLIGLYSQHKVRVLAADGSWETPQIQTYAAAHDFITSRILLIQPTIPAMTLDGGRSIKKVIKDYKKRIDRAHKLNH